MGLIQVRIPDELERVLRESIPAKKGALGKFVTEALEEKLERMGIWRRE